MGKSKSEQIKCFCMGCGKFFEVEKEDVKNVKNCVFCGKEMHFKDVGGKI